MSTCISSQGEFGEHILDRLHTCVRCRVLDEEALRVDLQQVTAELAEEKRRTKAQLAERQRDYSKTLKESTAEVERLTSELAAVAFERDLLAEALREAATNAEHRPTAYLPEGSPHSESCRACGEDWPCTWIMTQRESHDSAEDAARTDAAAVIGRVVEALDKRMNKSSVNEGAELADITHRVAAERTALDAAKRYVSAWRASIVRPLSDAEINAVSEELTNARCDILAAVDALGEPAASGDSPPLTDLIGLDPNFTGGLSASDYLSRMRGGLVEAERDVLAKAQAWRQWFPHVDSMFLPENALIAAVDALVEVEDTPQPADSRQTLEPTVDTKTSFVLGPDAYVPAGATADTPTCPTCCAHDHRAAAQAAPQPAPSNSQPWEQGPYRVGRHQAHNIYRVTEQHPEGVQIGCMFNAADGPLVVAALNATVGGA